MKRGPSAPTCRATSKDLASRQVLLHVLAAHLEQHVALGVTSIAAGP